MGIAHQNVQTRLHFHLAIVHLVPTLWSVLCSMPCVMVQRSKMLTKIKTRVTSEIVLLSQSRVLDGGATTTVCSGFTSTQPVVDQDEHITIETTDAGFTFSGGETDAASTKIWIPHADFPQGISVNFVSNESTPFLIGLDVIRDYHCNRVQNHIMNRHFPCAILPTTHLA